MTLNNTGQIIRSYIERAERLNDEISALNADKSEIFKEARGNGFDVNAIKEIIRLRKKDPEKRAELESIVETYMHAIGMER
jgi:uncharacterized protein (UPF0335 family)